MEKIRVEQSVSLSGAHLTGTNYGRGWFANLTREETEALISDLRKVLDAPKFPEPEGRYAVVHVMYWNGQDYPALFEKYFEGWREPGGMDPKPWTDVIDGAVKVEVLFAGFPR